MNLTVLKDNELIAGLSELLIEEQEKLVLQLEYLAELERRHLFFEYPSLWPYLVHELKMDESTAERRIRASRVMIRFPWMKAMLSSGKLNLSLLNIAQGVASREKLSDEEFSDLLRSISGMSCRAARREVAKIYPNSLTDFSDRISPLNGEVSEVRFVAPNDLIEQLEEIRGLLAHSHPGASLAELIQVMVSEYKQKHHPEEKAKRAQKRSGQKAEQQKEASKAAVENVAKAGNERPAESTPLNRSPSTEKVISASTRAPSHPLIHALVLRDGYQCSYKDEHSGRVCGSKHGLQIDHKRSYASGGKTELQNLRFLCMGHHARVSFLEFGERTQFFASKPRPK